VFGVEWSPEHIFMYVDNRLFQTLYLTFDEPFWTRGKFPLSTANGTRLDDVWGATGRESTPFDGLFYLSIGLSVGGTGGWFADGVGGKPWVDGSEDSVGEFWEGRGDWLPTWGDGAEMVIGSVMVS